MKIRIAEIQEEQYDEAVAVLRKAFGTVAKQFGLTPENAATNPAFITREKLHEWLKKDLVFFGLFERKILVGTVALEKNHDRKTGYFLERLCVLPSFRHKGYGGMLLDFALETVRDRGGDRLDMGIINENEKLKQWYLDYGFSEVCRKKFDHLPFTVCFLGMDF